MKYKISKTQSKFTPVVVTMTLESKKELDSLLALANSGPLEDKLIEAGGTEIFPCNFIDELFEAGATRDVFEEFVNKI